jgi:hypothetical protein
MDVGAVRSTAAQYDWFLLRSTDNVMIWDRFGTAATDLLYVHGDYDGDGQTDLAVWRSGAGRRFWVLLRQGLRSRRPHK